MGRAFGFATFAGLLAFAACSGSPAGVGPGGTGGGTSGGGSGGLVMGSGGATPTDDPEPAFTPAERAALQELRYDDGAPPADPSNRSAVSFIEHTSEAI